MPKMHPGLPSFMPHGPGVGPSMSRKGLPESLTPKEPGVHAYIRQGSSPRGLRCMFIPLRSLIQSAFRIYPSLNNIPDFPLLSKIRSNVLSNQPFSITSSHRITPEPSHAVWAHLLTKPAVYLASCRIFSFGPQGVLSKF